MIGRRGHTLIGAALAVLGLCPALATAAERCRGGLVVTGDYIDDVVRKCGEPESVSTRTKWIGGGYSYYGYRYPRQEILVETLTFDVGYGKFRKIMQFEDGTLTEIRIGERSE